MSLTELVLLDPGIVTLRPSATAVSHLVLIFAAVSVEIVSLAGSTGTSLSYKISLTELVLLVPGIVTLRPSATAVSQLEFTSASVRIEIVPPVGSLGSNLSNRISLTLSVVLLPGIAVFNALST